MQLQSRLLSLAIVSSFAVCAPAFAFNPSLSGPPVSALQAQLAAARASSLLNGPAAPAIKRASADGLVAGDVSVDKDGTEHVRFSRTFNGLPVIGGDFVTHTKAGQLKSINQTLSTVARPNVVPTISAYQATVQAGAEFGTQFTAMPAAKLVVYALGSASANPVLAYEVTYSGIKADQTPTDMHYFVDARTGKILNQWDTVETFQPGPDPGGAACKGAVAAVGTGNSLLGGVVPVDTIKCGNQYQMLDLTRGNGFVTNMGQLTSGNGGTYVSTTDVWGNSALNNSATIAADAHYGVSMTWDFYKTNFGRNGIANDGKGAMSRVHFGRNYVNAFWSDGCFCMTFGDGDGVTFLPLVALDVAGHEMSHGVTARTSALAYSGESGGLNEANSDIMGTMVEWFANNPTSPPNYEMGEKLFAKNPDGTKALRWMFKPYLDGTSPDCYSSTIGNLDVHYSSGVANHFYYLLAEGAVVPNKFGAGTTFNLTPASLVCNGNAGIVGIGRADAQQIWFRGMTVYMTTNTNYAGARAATLSAATDLFGANSTQYNAVAAAWSAVSVN